MKRIIKFIIATVIIMISGIGGYYSMNPSHEVMAASEDQESSLPQVSIDDYLENINGVKQIDASEYVNLINNQDSKQDFIFYFGFKDCPYCRAESVYLKDFIKKSKYPIYYINMEESLNDATDEEIEEINKSFGPYPFYGTPTFTFFRNKKIENMLVGYPVKVEDLEQIDNTSENFNSRAITPRVFNKVSLRK